MRSDRRGVLRGTRLAFAAVIHPARTLARAPARTSRARCGGIGTGEPRQVPHGRDLSAAREQVALIAAMRKLLCVAYSVAENRKASAVATEQAREA